MAAFVEVAAAASCWTSSATVDHHDGGGRSSTSCASRGTKQWRHDGDEEEDDRHKMLQLMLGPHVQRDHDAPLQTLDLLGSSGHGCCDMPPTAHSAYDMMPSIRNDLTISVESPDQLDLDAPLPFGWEKCLDLQTGKIYYLFKGSGSSRPPTSSRRPVNLMPPPLKHPSSPLHDTTVSTNASSEAGLNMLNHASMHSSSGCRAGTRCSTFEKNGAGGGSYSFTMDLNSSPVQEPACDVGLPNASSDQAASANSFEMTTVGCANCLMFVMLSRANPRCPNCGSTATLDFVQPVAKRMKRM